MTSRELRTNQTFKLRLHHFKAHVSRITVLDTKTQSTPNATKKKKKKKTNYKTPPHQMKTEQNVWRENPA